MPLHAAVQNDAAAVTREIYITVKCRVGATKDPCYMVRTEYKVILSLS